MSAPKVDAREFRQRYLETLRKQVAVNAKNLQANALFKQTQQPAPLEDTRSITEKTADDTQVQTLLRKELGKLTDAGSANSIVNSLDVNARKFLVENFGAVEEQLRRRFKFGFTKETFLPFFQRFSEIEKETGGFAPTATQIAEKVAPSIVEAVETGGFEDNDEMDRALYNLFMEMTETQASQIKNREWVPIRRYFQSKLAYVKNSDSGFNEDAKKLLLDITSKNRSDIKTKDADTYRRWFKTLDNQEKNAIFSILGIAPEEPNEPPPTASAVDDEEEYIIRPTARTRGMEELMKKGGYQGKGIYGCGLSKSSSKGKENITLEISEGMKAEPRFANFGRYLIDKGALNDNLCVIRFGSGACIHSIPKQKISSSLSKVLKGIAGGSLPTYDAIDALNNEERIWLYNTTKKAKLGINVPNPNKDAETKEIEEFEKMKGQIIAGNDNKDLVKKFKITLLKLAREGKVPKREANEVLMELALIGL